MTSSYTTVDKVDWSSSTIKRAGIIPVIYHNDILWFGMPLTMGTTTLADFGGTVPSINDIEAGEPSDYDALATAIREWEEETHDIFGDIVLENLTNSYVLVDDRYKKSRTILYFIDTDASPWEYISMFNDRSDELDEAATITFLSINQLSNVLSGKSRNYDIPHTRIRAVQINKYLSSPLATFLNEVSQDDIIHRANLPSKQLERRPLVIDASWKVHIDEDTPYSIDNVNRWGYNIYVSIWPRRQMLAIANEHRDIYIFKRRMKDKYFRILKDIRELRFHKALYSDRIGRPGSKSIEREINIAGEDSSNYVEYIEYLRRTATGDNEYDKIIDEIKTMIREDFRTYHKLRKNTSAKNFTTNAIGRNYSIARHCLIDDVNNTNRMVVDQINDGRIGINRGVLIDYLARIKRENCDVLDSTVSVNVMIELGLFRQIGEDIVLP